MEIFKRYEQDDSVFINGEIKNQFASLYLDIREQENRVLTDDLVARLPHLPKDHDHYKEWLKRIDTLNRFEKYLKNHSFKTVVEIGCGNGWFTNWLSKYCEVSIGQDVNLPELKQGARVFNHEAVKFICTTDVVKLIHDVQPDLIVFNASLQYFNPEENILEELKQVMKKGEIHVLDSPIYETIEQAKQAKERTFKYYSSKGLKELAAFYYHWKKTDLKADFLYSPKGKLGRFFYPDASPFPWVRVIVG